ncbi:YwqG family protein [Desmospora activa]|uniref:Uncharacterized protein YwqG n=1 Tax=Desmospora activa DSM 45169 TaxID=1121389 RepID=A0A2T4Z717_9BACL|nr:YwqG family protein [Desmospora activa]PTM57698.1 uncharacterized protein YwqG [Desmospora activa DSM 45169]
MKEQLLAAIHELELDAYKERIFAELQPALRIQTKRNEQLSIGSSKFGGKPDLPLDFTYPLYEGERLVFLAQYRLADFASFPVARELPQKGMLYFFHHEEHDGEPFPLGLKNERDGWRVIYREEDDPSLLRPYDIEEIKHYPQTEIGFEEIYTGNLGRLGFDIEKEEANEGGAPAGMLAYAFSDLMELCEIDLGHQLLGTPIPQQGPVIEELHKFDFPELKGKEMVLLLQLDCDNRLEMSWGDCGTLYFLIPLEDLRKRNFAETVYTAQMG